MAISVQDFLGGDRPSDPVDVLGEFQKGQAFSDRQGARRELKQIASENLTPVARNKRIGEAALRAGNLETGHKFFKLAEDIEQKEAALKLQAENDSIDALKEGIEFNIKHGNPEATMRFIDNKLAAAIPESKEALFLESVDNVDLNNRLFIRTKKVTAEDQASMPFLNQAEIGDTVSFSTSMDTNELVGNVTQVDKPAGAVLSKPALKAAIALQAKGGRQATQEDMLNLPEGALTTIGIGDNAIVMVRPKKQLSTTDSTKFAVAKQARNEAVDLMEDLKDSNFLKNSIVGVPGLKKFTQDLSKRANFIREGLARALSGAAVPETEQVRFQDIFAISPGDTLKTINYKLGRVVTIVDDLETSVLYGADSGMTTVEQRQALIEAEKAKIAQLNSDEEQEPATPAASQVPTGNGQVQKIGRFTVKAK